MIKAVWALALAYRKNTDLDEDRAKCYEYTASAVKTMRALLQVFTIFLSNMISNVFQAMMRQSHKIEKFKSTQNVEDAIHAKFDSRTLSPVVGDNEEGIYNFL